MLRLGLSGALRATTADRATFPPRCLGLFARPFVSCTHSMCSFSTLAGNLALLLGTHRGKSAPTTLICLHVSTLFLFSLVEVVWSLGYMLNQSGIYSLWQLPCKHVSFLYLKDNSLIH